MSFDAALLRRANLLPDRLAQPKPAQRAPVDKDDAERPEINLAIASQIVRELKPTAGTRGEAYLAEARGR
jgi:hypothetical protein